MKAVKLLLWFGLCGGVSFAQNATFSTDVRVVNVLATVHDAQGGVVKNLGKDDFVLEEDGRPQTIRYFSQDSGLPLIVGLLVDTSISQERILGEERTASYRFLTQVLRSDQDRAFVIHFDRDVELLQDLTASRERLSEALANLATPAQRARSAPKPTGPKIGAWALGGTALYDAVLLASDDLMRTQSGRKALILLTDGVDNGSKVGLSRAIESAQRADTLVYSVLFTDHNAYDGTYASANGKRAMERASQETGGALFEVSKTLTIADIYLRLEQELRSQYSLGYTSDRPVDRPGYRRIALSTKQAGLQVQTRSGYYVSK